MHWNIICNIIAILFATLFALDLASLLIVKMNNLAMYFLIERIVMPYLFCFLRWLKKYSFSHGFGNLLDICCGLPIKITIASLGEEAVIWWCVLFKIKFTYLFFFRSLPIWEWFISWQTLAVSATLPRAAVCTFHLVYLLQAHLNLNGH